MTDEQVIILEKAFKESSLTDDLIVAVVSGLILLLISTVISFIISKHESKKALDEMKERIKLETEEILKMQRKFYLDQTKMDDLIKFEKYIAEYEKVLIDLIRYIIEETSGHEFDLEKTNELANKILNYSDLILGFVKTYEDIFTSDEVLDINDSIHKVLSIATRNVNFFINNRHDILLESKNLLKKINLKVTSYVFLARVKRYEELDKIKQIV